MPNPFGRKPGNTSQNIVNRPVDLGAFNAGKAKSTGILTVEDLEARQVGALDPVKDLLGGAVSQWPSDKQTSYKQIYDTLLSQMNSGQGYNKDVRDVLQSWKGKNKPTMEDMIATKAAEMANAGTTLTGYNSPDRVAKLIHNDWAGTLNPAAEGGVTGLQFLANQVNQTMGAGVSKEQLGYIPRDFELQKQIYDASKKALKETHPDWSDDQMKNYLASDEGMAKMTSATADYKTAQETSQTTAFNALSPIAGADRTAAWKAEKERESAQRSRTYGVATLAAAVVGTIFGVPGAAKILAGSAVNIAANKGEGEWSDAMKAGALTGGVDLITGAAQSLGAIVAGGEKSQTVQEVQEVLADLKPNTGIHPGSGTTAPVVTDTTAQTDRPTTPTTTPTQTTTTTTPTATSETIGGLLGDATAVNAALLERERKAKIDAETAKLKQAAQERLNRQRTAFNEEFRKEGQTQAEDIAARGFTDTSYEQAQNTRLGAKYGRQIAEFTAQENNLETAENLRKLGEPSWAEKFFSNVGQSGTEALKDMYSTFA